MVLALAWTAFLLWILYGTNAVYENGSRIPYVCVLMRVREYLTFKQHDPQLQYSDFMLTHRPGFFVKLFSCPVCFGVWIAAGVSLLFGCVWQIPVVYGGGLLSFYVFRWVIRWTN